jgi:ribosomal protein S18 acetylase RimI-like enzyme
MLSRKPSRFAFYAFNGQTYALFEIVYGDSRIT